jgi:hypothetical protein
LVEALCSGGAGIVGLLVLAAVISRRNEKLGHASVQALIRSGCNGSRRGRNKVAGIIATAHEPKVEQVIDEKDGNLKCANLKEDS